MEYVQVMNSSALANSAIQTAQGAANDTIGVAGSNPLIFEDDKVFQWNQFYVAHTGKCIDEDLLLTGLEFKTDITGRDPSKWSVVSWYFNGLIYATLEDFQNAIKSPDFVKPGAPVDGPWACTDTTGEPLPHDDQNPPVSVAPSGERYSIDEESKYVEWSKS